MTRYRAPPRRRGLLGNFVHSARKALYTADHFLRASGPMMKQIAMVAAPAIAKTNPAAGAAVAAIGQAADGYSQLRQQLGD
jgi:hypothetical protein